MNFYNATFYDEYTALTEAEILKKLTPTPTPTSAGCVSDALEGKSVKLVLDGGPKLAYSFGKNTLSLVENDAVLTDVPYAAKELQNIVLFTHLIPGTLRGYTVVADRKTRLVTVYETWFGGYERAKREVWREFWHGYVDDGENPPEKRHALTNRVENTGTHWKDDDGSEYLLFFPSVIWSSFVELDDPRGGITKTAPSDFFKINDRFYIYSRVECEFSGAFTLEVIDLMKVRHIGVHLGFDLQDTLVYSLYSGEGEVTGHAATLEGLTDYGTTIDLGAFGPSPEVKQPRGTRPAYRPKVTHIDFTAEQTAEIIRTNSKIFDGNSIMSSANTMEITDYMVGRKFTLRYDDGEEYEYDILSIDKLKWRVPGGEWQEETYNAFEPAPDIIFFSHILTGSDPVRNFSPAVDFSTGLVTNVNAKLGCELGAWQVQHRAQFGVVIADGIVAPEVRRHTFTTELVGKVYSWTYSSFMKSIHVYSSPESYSWTIMLDNGAGGFMWSSPCLYVKLREDAYLMSWTEDNCNGNQGSIVFNPRIMHDSGFFFGLGEGKSPDLHLTTTGAYARDLGTMDIRKYFGEKK